METKQSSIEWLIEILERNNSVSRAGEYWNLLKKTTREMHKQEIIEAYKFGISDEYVIGSQKYYNETFGK